jgi:AcrR family transcriptional regulator
LTKYYGSQHTFNGHGAMNMQTRSSPGAGTVKSTRKLPPGRPGGAKSRERILANAGRLFAARGYNGVSMRGLAQAAKVNLGAINYHFGGKAALYHETVCRLIDDIGPLFGPIIRRLELAVGAAKSDPAALSICAADFVQDLVAAVLGVKKMRWQMAFLMREFHQPSREFPLLVAQRIGPMHDAVGALAAAALGGKREAPQNRIRAAAIVAQIMSFEAVREMVCARLCWKEYTPGNVAFVGKVLTPMILGSLGLPLVTRVDAGEAL